MSDRLEALSGQGLLEARAYQERPQRHEYHLTEKGAELIPALLALMQWGDRWTWPEGTGPVRVVHDHCGHEVRVEVDCPHCERSVATDELRAKPRAPLPPSLTDPDARPGQHRPGEVSGRRLYAAEHGVSLGA